jgi:hypothetical protein
MKMINPMCKFFHRYAGSCFSCLEMDNLAEGIEVSCGYEEKVEFENVHFWV